MKAVILAAGNGIRMRPLTLEKPKPMLGINGKPILEHIWGSLPDNVKEVILVVGHKGEMIREYFGNSFKGKKIQYIEQKEQLGPAHALLLARSYLNPQEKFLLLFADGLYKKESIEKCLKHDRCILMSEVEDPKRFGVVVTDNEGRVIDIEEKPKYPKSNLVCGDAYVFDHKIFDYEGEKESDGEYYLPKMVQKLIREHPVFTEKASSWISIAYPEDLEKAERILLQ